MALFLIYMMALQVSPSIIASDLIEEFKIDASLLGLMAGFYFYSYTLMQVPSGLLYDRFSLRWVTACAVFLCAIGSLIFGATHSIALSSVARLLMGTGSAFAFVGLLTVSARFFPPSLFALLTGVTQFLAAIGAVGGGYPLASLISHLGWRPTFIFLGAFGLLVMFLILAFVKDRPSDASISPILSSTKIKVLDSLKIIMNEPQSWWIGLYALCGYSPVMIFAALWGVPFMMRKFQLTNTEAAMGISMIWLGLAFLSPILGWFSDLIQRRRILLIGSAILGLITTSCLVFLPNLSFTMLMILLFLFGCSTSGQLLTFPLNKENNRPSLASTVVGFNNMAVVIGGALFQPLVGWLLTKNWDKTTAADGSPIYSTGDYERALIILPLCFLIGLLCSLFLIKETHCKPKYDPFSDQLL